VSRSRNRHGRTERLSEGALAFLDAGLQAIKNTPAHAHARRVERLGVTYRPCKRGSDFLPQAHIPFDDFRLMSLSHRWCDRSGAVNPIVVLGAYKPVVDLPDGTGRITFTCEGALTVGRLGGRVVPDPRTNLSGCRTAVLLSQAVDDDDAVELAPALALPRFAFAFPPNRPPVFESGRPTEEWEAAEIKIGDLRAWPIEFFARPLGARYDVNPVDGSADPFAGETAAVEEGTILGTWVLSDGVATPLAQEPLEIFADLTRLGGRTVRNPAWHALQANGVIPPRLGYRQWLERVSPYTGTGRDAPDADDPSTEAGQFRARLADCVDREGIDNLMQDVRDSCQAAGVPVPVDPAEAYAFLASLLEDPWLRTEVEGQASLQRVRLTGLPDPSTMTFSNGVLAADLYSLAGYTEQYAQLPAGRVVEALEQRRRGPQGARPWRRATT
jgi:hypothetical protein